MRAWQLSNLETTPRLVLTDVAQPTVGPDEVLVKVRAAGVTPTELRWHPTTHTKTGGHRAHAIPGHEFSGVVAQVGKWVEDVLEGDEVYGMNDWFSEGATAEYCLTRPEFIAPKPTTLTHAQAASVPIGALTAWQGLFGKAKLEKGEYVLVNGASGGVGVYVVQLAVRHGANVIATASARNEAFLRSLGVQRVIDYKTDKFETMVTGVNVVFDCVGGETLQKSWAVLGMAGRMVAIATETPTHTDERSKAAFFIVQPRSSELATIADLIDTGELKPVLDIAVPFDQAPMAYARQAHGKQGRGKVVIEI
jgi:NADPH:quinone reductase-like Zn-dependent oxidoreductase